MVLDVLACSGAPRGIESERDSGANLMSAQYAGQVRSHGARGLSHRSAVPMPNVEAERTDAHLLKHYHWGTA